MENQQIVFAYYYKGEFKGFRADTFNTISTRYPKVYTYSPEQVRIVMDNVLESCNNTGKSFFTNLSKLTPTVITAEGAETDINTVIDHVSKTELTFREWGEFEVRVHPFSNAEEFFNIEKSEEWKLDKLLSELQPALETRKFKIVQNEN
jgi:hypothetical protein